MSTCIVRSSKTRHSVAIALALLVSAGEAAELVPSVQGEWHLYGHDLENSRRGDAGPSILQLPFLVEQWRFAPEGNRAFLGTPIVAGGRVFVASDAGVVYSLDGASGEPDWQTPFELPPAGSGFSIGSGIPASLAFHDGVIYVPLSIVGRPEIAALDAATGDLLWRTVVDEIDPETGTRHRLRKD